MDFPLLFVATFLAGARGGVFRQLCVLRRVPQGVSRPQKIYIVISRDATVAFF